MSPWRRLALLVAALAALTLAGPGCSSRRPSAPLPVVEQPLGLLARPTLAGERFDPSRLAGKAVVVNFWSPG